MSVDVSIYIGPFLKCTVHRKIQQKTIHGCVHPTCSASKGPRPGNINTPFCALCGHPCGPITVSGQVEQVDPYQLQDAVQNMLLHEEHYDGPDRPNQHLWIANDHIPGLRQFQIAASELSEAYVETFDPDGERVAFSQHFQAVIGIISNAYTFFQQPAGTVSLCWGLIGRCH